MKKYVRSAIYLLCAVLLLSPVLSACTAADTHRDYSKYADNTEVVGGISRNSNSSNGSYNSTSNNSGYKSVSAHTEIVPNDYVSAVKAKARAKKSRTVLLYMNGSDLESEYASATSDLQEILDSGFDEKNMNIVIFTGGAKKWHTPNIPNNINALFTVTDGKLVKLANIGKDSMGYPETLAGFINFGTKIFPAAKYNLILWNHGGGAIAGYGSDERYERDPSKAMMKLSEIDSALGSTDLYKSGGKLEILGFDTCLMATLEMACIAQKYADYMVASEELEPDPGWDYYYLGEVRPEDSGLEVGQLIVDYYREFYEYYFAYFEIEDIITMSLTDLSKVQAVADAFEKFAASARLEIANGNFSVISKARSRSRMFGSRGERAGETDMIDAGNLAESLRRLIPRESSALIKALNRAVVYKHEAYIEAEEVGGLSIYFPFVNKQDLSYSLDVYREINQLPEYTDFIGSFAEVLDSAPLVNYRSVIKSAADGETSNTSYRNSNNKNNNISEGEHNISLTPEQVEHLAEIHQTTWRKSDLDGRYIRIEQHKNTAVSESPDNNGGGEVTVKFNNIGTALNGHLVCLYELDTGNNNSRRYAIPVKLNSNDADLLAVYSDKHPDGKIIGAVPTGDDVYNMLDKKIVQVRAGDIIQILYYAEDFGSDNAAAHSRDEKNGVWQKGEEFTVPAGGLTLGREKLREGEYLCGVSFVDIQQNKYHSNFVEIKN